MPVQQIDPPYKFNITVLSWTGVEEPRQSQEVADWLREEGRKKFNFETDPMIRVTLLKLKPQEHLLVVTEHHLIHDGWTQGVLLKEFITIFTAYSQGQNHRLPELPIQYADFAIWQRQYMQGEVLEAHLDYWRKKLSGLIPVLELPADRPRPAVISGRGGTKELLITSSLTAALKKFSQQEDVTLFMTMLAVFKIFLYRCTGEEDLCVGTGIANRQLQEIEGMLGMVINTLALRTQISGRLTSRDYLQRVKQTCLEAYEHEDTPFGKVVEATRPERSLSYTPICQVLFGFMDVPTQDLQLPGLQLTSEDSHNQSSKFDLNVLVVPLAEHPGEEHGRELLIVWEYSSDLFDETTIDKMLNHYRGLLEEVVTSPGQCISALPMTEKKIKTTKKDNKENLHVGFDF